MTAADANGVSDRGVGVGVGIGVSLKCGVLLRLFLWTLRRKSQRHDRPGVELPHTTPGPDAGWVTARRPGVVGGEQRPCL
jgi:hypothetical protein